MSNPIIEFPASVQDAVEEHCFSRTDAEVGGFLIGHIDDSGTHITAARAALAAQSGQTHLTFTHDAWDEVLPLLETDYPGQAIVGWYHSHPGFGVFLSEYDVFIQENFFGSPGQVALVVDPLAGSYGFLTASGGEAKEVLTADTNAKALAKAGADKVDVAATPGQSDLPQRRALPLVLAALALGIIAAAAGWFVGSIQGQDQASQSAQARISDLQAEVGSLEDQLASALAAPPAPDPIAEPTPDPTPEPTPSPPAPPTGPQPGDAVLVTVEHVLAPGETLWTLASRYLGSGERFTEIVEANPGIDAENLQAGQVIVIPVSATLVSG